MNDIGAAVVGTGFMGWVHVEALRRVGVKIVGLLGSTPAKSRQAADRLGDVTTYGSFAEVLTDDRVQAVHIGTPNRWHFDLAKRALQAKKHVMCEKPLAMSTTESAELVRLAGERPELAAAVNYNIRYYPLCIEARDRVCSGSLGEVFHVSGSYVQDWLLLPTDYNWRVLADEGGALRAIADIGTHWLDLVYATTGLEVQAVCADLQTVHSQRQRPVGEVKTFHREGKSGPAEALQIATEDAGSVMIRFQGGARGLLHVSQVVAGRKNCLRLEIAGSNHSLAWNSEQPNELWLGHRDRPNESLLRDPSLLCEAARSATDYPGGHNEGYDDSFKQCFRAFYEYISAGDWAARPTFPTFADGHREIVICEAILKSHTERSWIEL